MSETFTKFVYKFCQHLKVKLTIGQKICQYYLEKSYPNPEFRGAFFLLAIMSVFSDLIGSAVRCK
jgi:hypothetical protein